MDALPNCGLSQIIPCTSAHLYCAARQGAPCSTSVDSTKLNYCLSADVRPYARNLPVRIGFLRAASHALTVIHSMLTLAIQSGAFLHLVVTLTAIAARLAHLSSSLRRVLSILYAESLRLLDKLYVRSKQPVAATSTCNRADDDDFPVFPAYRSYAQLDATATTTIVTT
jgi:hypothetical protein